MPPDRIVSTETHLISFDASEGIRALQSFNAQMTVVADSIKAQALAIAQSMQAIADAARQLGATIPAISQQVFVPPSTSQYRDPNQLGPYFGYGSQPVAAPPYSSIGDLQRAYQAQMLAGRGGTFEQDPQYLQWLQSQFGGMPPGMAFARGPSPISPITSPYDPTGYNAETLRRFHAESQLSSTPMGDYLGIQRESASLRQMRQGTLFDTSLYGGGAYTGQERAQLAELMMGMERDAPRFGGKPLVYDREGLLYNRPQFRPSDIWPQPKGMGRQIDEEAFISGIDSSRVPSGDAKAKAGGGFDFLDRVGRIAEYYAIWQAFQAGMSVISSFTDNMLQLNDAMVNFEVVTGKGSEEAKKYLDIAQEIGRTVGIPGTQILPDVAIAQRAGLPSQIPTYTAQIQRAYGIEASSAMGEYISLMRAFPQNNPQQFGDMFAKMMQQSAFVSPNQAWSLFGSAAPIAQQYGMGLEQYTNVLTAMGRSQPERDPGTMERLLRRMIDIYEKPDTRRFVETAIGRPVTTTTDAGVEVRENLYDILRSLSKATPEQQRLVAESFPSQLGQPWSTMFLPLMGAMREMDKQAITSAEAQGTLNASAALAMNTSTAAVSNVKSAFQELAGAIGGGEVIVTFLNRLAFAISDTATSIKAGPPSPEEVVLRAAYEQGGRQTYEQYKQTGGIAVREQPTYGGLTYEQWREKYRGFTPLGETISENAQADWQAQFGIQPTTTPYQDPRLAGRVRTIIPPLGYRTFEDDRGYTGPPIQTREYRQIQGTNELPAGLSIAAVMAEYDRLKAQRAEPIQGPGGLTYQYPGLNEVATVVSEASGVFKVVTVDVDYFGRAIQSASGILMGIINVNLPEGVSLTGQYAGKYQGMLGQADQLLKQAGIPQGEDRLYQLYNPANPEFSGPVSGTPEQLAIARDLEARQTRETTKAMADLESKTKAAAGAFGSFLEGKLFSAQGRTDVDFAETRLGIYQGRSDEQLARVQATVNALNAGRGRDKLEPYMWDIINDPNIQKYFPEGSLTPGGRAVKPGDRDFDLRTVGLSRYTQAYTSGAIPKTGEEWSAVARDVDQWAESRRTREATLKQAEQILPGLVKPENQKELMAWIAQQKQAPGIAMLTGGDTPEQIQKQAKDAFGTPAAEGVWMGYEKYMHDKNIPKQTGQIWLDQASKPENVASLIATGKAMGNVIFTGALDSIKAQDMINAIAVKVFNMMNDKVKDK